MKTKHWIIIITKSNHLTTPYIVTEADNENPLVCHSKEQADKLNESCGGIVFEYTTESNGHN